jgi:GTP-dependent dephospho-CoA kinase
MKISASVKAKLKKPLGSLERDFRRIKTLSRSHRITSVGDICTLSLLALGVRPHLAVFDHQFMRKKLDSGMVSMLDTHFGRARRYRNPAGTLSERIVKDAKRLLAEGGAVLIDGEEDLTALAFIMAAGKKDIIIYGQPHRGMVIVKPDGKLKKKIEGWLAAS